MTLVTIKCASDEGHTEYKLVAAEAIAKARQLYDESDGKKWIYHNGSAVSPSRLTEAMFEISPKLTIMNSVQGGSSDDYDCADCTQFDDCTEALRDEYMEELQREEELDDPCGSETTATEPELAADFELDIKPFENSRGEVTIEASDPKAAMVMVFEFIPGDAKKANKVNVLVNEKYFVEVAHMRSLILKGANRVFDEYMQGELANFKKVYNV